MLPVPSFAEESLLRAQGYRLIAGVDEAGRGALAGPVVAGAVILPGDIDAPWLSRVRDSKLLSPTERERLYPKIRKAAISFGIGIIRSQYIDRYGIVKATHLAMKQAIDRLSPQADSLLIDYLSLPEVSLPQKGIVDGDSLCLSIACASIVAKVARDHMMLELDSAYPGYGLAQHKGYGTRQHLSCLDRLGPCPIHRRSFQPVKNVI